MTANTVSRWVGLSVVALMSAVSLGAAASSAALAGRWDAHVIVDGVDVPFVFEITADGDSLTGSFFNGERRISSTEGRAGDGPQLSRVGVHRQRHARLRPAARPAGRAG